MTSDNRRILICAARIDQLCVLFMRGKELCDWQVSRKGARNPKAAATQMRKWIDEFRPDILISENPDTASRKGEKNTNILRAIAAVCEDNPALNMIVTRAQRYKNLYEEAAILAMRYPQLMQWSPKKQPIWKSEPRNVIYFEALSMALLILDE